MSLLIKDMEMPPCCYQCWNCDKNFTDENGLDIADWICLVRMRFVGEEGKDTRPEWCPLADPTELANKCYAVGYDDGYGKALSEVEKKLGLDQRRNKNE